MTFPDISGQILTFSPGATHESRKADGYGRFIFYSPPVRQPLGTLPKAITVKATIAHQLSSQPLSTKTYDHLPKPGGKETVNRQSNSLHAI